MMPLRGVVMSAYVTEARVQRSSLLHYSPQTTTMSTAKPRGVLVGRTNTRDVLFKLRLRYAYGCDPEYYDEVLAYKGRFELCIAIPPVAAVEKFLSPEPLPDADSFPDSEFTEGVRDQLLAEWPLLFTAERDDNTTKDRKSVV